MKRTAAFLLLFTLVFSASVTSFAQKSRSARPVPVSSDFVRFQEIRSFSDGQGVFVGWQTEFETGNLGFYVYRMTNDGPQLVSSSFVGGFAMRSSAPTGYGETYEFYDPNGTLSSAYYIQGVSTQGSRLPSWTFAPKFTDNFQRDAGHPKEYFEDLAQNRNGQIQSRNSKLPKELQNTASPLPPDLNMQRWVAAQPGAKIAVRNEGIYRVTRTELQNAGFNVNSNSANWRLFMEGNEQAIIVGASDQYIEFYGRSLDTVESDTRMYYLIADNVPGKRINTRVLRNQGGNVVSNSYTASGVKKLRELYVPSIINGPAENFFSQQPITTDGMTVPFGLNNVDFGVPTCSVTLKIQGFTIHGPHNILATLNGHNLGFVTGDDYNSMTATFTGVPTSFLLEGANTLTMVTGGGADLALFDTVTVNYARRYTADQNRLGFFTPGYRKADVGNFTSPNVRVFDTTYDSNAQLLLNFPIVNTGGTFTAKLPSDRAAVMFAVEDSGLLQSPSVTFNTPSTLSTPANSADVLIISYSAADYLNASNLWADYRRSSTGGNYSVKVVDVADIFDEFGYGVLSSDAVTGFLEYAKTNWQAPQPAYVLLMGDASYDPRNYEGRGNWDLVPTKIVPLLFNESGSDEALSDYDHNGTANIPIGRIPARIALDITTSLNKAMGFETPGGQDLQGRGALFGFDLPNTFDFEAMSVVLRNELPPGTLIYWVPRGLPPPNQNEPDPQAHAHLLSGLNSGPFIVNYSGHGSAGIWASTGYFSNNDVPTLVNGSNQSIYTMLTCLNGLFIRPADDSIAEMLVKAPNGGGVAAWASSTDTTPDLQLLMGDRFYRQLSAGEIHRLGDLIADAKSVIPPGSDVGFSWVLLGDPALKVR